MCVSFKISNVDFGFCNSMSSKGKVYFIQLTWHYLFYCNVYFLFMRGVFICASNFVIQSTVALPQVFLPTVTAIHRESGKEWFSFDALSPDVRAICSVCYPVKPSAKADKVWSN